MNYGTSRFSASSHHCAAADLMTPALFDYNSVSGDPLARLAAHCNNLHSPTAPSLPVSSPLGGALPLPAFTPADAYSVDRPAGGFQPWRYSLYTNAMALSDASRNYQSNAIDKHQDMTWFRGALPSFPPPPTPEVHDPQCQPAHALSGFGSGFTGAGFGDFSSASSYAAPVHPSAMHFAAVAHHFSDSLYSPTGTTFGTPGGGVCDGAKTLNSGGYADMTSFSLGPPSLPLSSASTCCLESPRNALGGWPRLDGPGYASTATSQACCNGTSRYFSPWNLAPLSTSSDNKLSDRSTFGTSNASSPARKPADSNKLISSKSRQSVSRRRAGVTGGGGSTGRGSSSCECPNCREAERVGGAVGEQLRRLGQHSCHVPGCGKVYAKTSHLKAHLHWHSGERPFVCSWLLCGKRFTRADELQRHLRSHAAADNQDAKRRAAEDPPHSHQNTGPPTSIANVAAGSVKPQELDVKAVPTSDVISSDNQHRKRATKRHSSTTPQTTAVKT